MLMNDSTYFGVIHFVIGFVGTFLVVSLLRLKKRVSNLEKLVVQLSKEHAKAVYLSRERKP